MNGVLRLARNISSNYLKVGINALILLLLTPYVVNQLGGSLYAVWVILLTLGYYLDFLDLGIADAQVQRHSVLASQGVTVELGRLHGTVLTVFLGAGAVALLLSFVLVLLPTAELFDVPENARGIYQIVLPLIGLSALFSFAELGINGIFESYQRYDLMNAIDIIIAVVYAAGTFMVLHLGYGLLGMALVKVASDAMGAAAKIIAARRCFPAHAFPRLGFDRKIWHSIRGFSLWNSLNDLMTEGTANLDKLLIPILLGSALLTPYALTVMVAASVMAVAEPITETFFPIASRSHGRNDAVGLGVLLSRGSKGVNMITLPVLMIVLCFGDSMLGLWIGEEDTAVPLAVLWFTAINFYFSTYLWTSLSVLAGSGKVRLLFWSSLLEVVLTLAMIFVLAPKLGLPGLVLAGLVSNIGIGIGILLPGACRLTGLRLGPFLLRTLVVPVAATSPALALGLWLRYEVRPMGWLETGACVGLTGLAAFACVFLALTGRWERLRYRAMLRHIFATGRA